MFKAYCDGCGKQIECEDDQYTNVRKLIYVIYPTNSIFGEALNKSAGREFMCDLCDDCYNKFQESVTDKTLVKKVLGLDCSGV